ncbi:MAG: hypothetical protein ABIK83_08170 [Candidatus Zixiibacteriota bacterium]
MKVLPGPTTDLKLEAVLGSASSSTVVAPDARTASVPSVVTGLLILLLVFVFLLLMPDHEPDRAQQQVHRLTDAYVYEVTPVEPPKVHVNKVKVPKVKPQIADPMEDPKMIVPNDPLVLNRPKELEPVVVVDDPDVEKIYADELEFTRNDDLPYPEPAKDEVIPPPVDSLIHPTGGNGDIDDIGPPRGPKPDPDPVPLSIVRDDILFLEEDTLPLIPPVKDPELPKGGLDKLVDLPYDPACFPIVNIYLRNCVIDLFTNRIDSYERSIFGNGRISVSAVNYDRKRIVVRIGSDQVTVNTSKSGAEDFSDPNFIVPEPVPSTREAYTEALMLSAKGLCKMLGDENCLNELEL